MLGSRGDEEDNPRVGIDASQMAELTISLDSMVVDEDKPADRVQSKTPLMDLMEVDESLPADGVDLKKSSVLVAVVGFFTARSLIFLVIRFVAFVVGCVVIVVRLVLSSTGFFCGGIPNDRNRCDVQGSSFRQVSEASLADP